MFARGLVYKVLSALMCVQPECHGVDNFPLFSPYNNLNLAISFGPLFERVIVFGTLSVPVCTDPHEPFVSLCCGACNADCSSLFGQPDKYTGWMLLLSMAEIVNLALIITLLTIGITVCLLKNRVAVTEQHGFDVDSLNVEWLTTTVSCTLTTMTPG